jgi:hypothetical protein
MENPRKGWKIRRSNTGNSQGLRARLADSRFAPTDLNPPAPHRFRESFRRWMTSKKNGCWARRGGRRDKFLLEVLAHDTRWSVYRKKSTGRIVGALDLISRLG